MKFVDPLWLPAGLAACGTLLWTWRRYDARQRAALAVFASSHLHAQLTASFSSARRNWKRGLFLAAVACLFVALARPQAGFRWERVTRRGVEVIFAVDTSRSMLTPDVKPDRLTRAKLAVDDFVNHLNGDGVGLIAFAGDAFLQCPITLDYDAFHDSLQALDTTIIPRGGTDIAGAIREGQAALQSRPSSDRVLVLLTDGEDLAGNALTAAKAAAKEGLKIYTVGVGTANGDVIPIPDEQGGGFVKDDAGQFVKSHLDEAGLKAIAQATGGIYAPLGAEGQGLKTIYQAGLAPLAKHDLASRRQKVYTERYQWPLAASLFLLLAGTMLGTRRRVVGKQAAPVVERPRSPLLAHAALIIFGAFLAASLSQTHASPATAEKEYHKGDFAAAEREYAAAAQHSPAKTDLEFNAGTAAYKAGQFAQAEEAFQKSLGGTVSADPKRLAAQEDAYYNLGDTFYRTGQKTEQSKPQETIQSWEQSVKTYDAALQLRANDADAKYNRDFVQKKLEQLKKKQERQQKQNQKQEQKKQNEQNQSAQNSENKKQQNKEQKQGGKNQPDQGAEAKSQEKKEQKSAENSKSGQPKNQQQANNGSKPQQQKQPGQEGQPKPANGQPQINNQAQADEPRVPGQMTKEEARSLLDSLKNEEQRLPSASVARNGNNARPSDQPIKDW